ncbi:hypothetical protein CARUB_v10024879mg [Capsella rubella]|uniref:Uncharacterized protein n=1 Tax=Capsella rubella TaxID=81985 RepID=R0FZU7_9BRAS|nr:hypothetical protein CARUB_v10024879mg [Capsella rubella]
MKPPLPLPGSSISGSNLRALRRQFLSPKPKMLFHFDENLCIFLRHSPTPLTYLKGFSKIILYCEEMRLFDSRNPEIFRFFFISQIQFRFFFISSSVPSGDSRQMKQERTDIDSISHLDIRWRLISGKGTSPESQMFLIPLVLVDPISGCNLILRMVHG